LALGLPDFSWSKIPKQGKIYQIIGSRTFYTRPFFQTDCKVQKLPRAFFGAFLARFLARFFGAFFRRVFSARFRRVFGAFVHLSRTAVSTVPLIFSANRHATLFLFFRQKNWIRDDRKLVKSRRRQELLPIK
jgi:hypothetical protein